MVIRGNRAIGYLLAFLAYVGVSLLLDFIDTGEVRIVNSVLLGIIVVLMIFLAERIQRKRKCNDE